MADEDTRTDSTDWWLSHIGEMADHYRTVYQRHELRARYVLVVIGFVIAGVRILFGDFSISTWSTNNVFLFIWFSSLILAAMLLVCVMVPLSGSRFFQGSFEDVIYRYTKYLNWSALKKLNSYPLSEKFQNAANAGGHRGLAARQCLARYLYEEFRTEFDQWLVGELPAMVDGETYDIRRRQIFWYWANKESSNKKAVLLEIAIATILWSSALSIVMWLITKIIVSILFHIFVS
jgi:hypothetical protein